MSKARDGGTCGGRAADAPTAEAWAVSGAIRIPPKSYCRLSRRLGRRRVQGRIAARASELASRILYAMGLGGQRIVAGGLSGAWRTGPRRLGVGQHERAPDPRVPRLPPPRPDRAAGAEGERLARGRLPSLRRR